MKITSGVQAQLQTTPDQQAEQGAVHPPKHAISAFERPTAAQLQQFIGKQSGAQQNADKAQKVLDILSVHTYRSDKSGLNRRAYGRLLSHIALGGSIGDVEARQMQLFLEKHVRIEDLAFAAELIEQLVADSDLTIDKKARGRLFHFFKKRGITMASLASTLAGAPQHKVFDRALFTEVLDRAATDKRLSTNDLRRLLGQLKDVQSDQDVFWAMHSIRRRMREGGWDITKANKERLDKFFSRRLEGRLDRETFLDRLDELAAGQAHINQEQFKGILDDLGGVFDPEDLAFADRHIKRYLTSGDLTFETPDVQDGYQEYFSHRLAGFVDREGIEESLDEMQHSGQLSAAEARAIKIALACSENAVDFVSSVLFLFALSRPELAESYERMREAINEFFRIMAHNSSNTMIVFADGTVLDIKEELAVKEHKALQELIIDAQQQALKALAVREQIKADLEVNPPEDLPEFEEEE